MVLQANLGRSRELREILRYRRAALVGQLLLGDLDELPAVTEEHYANLPRREIKAELQGIRQALRTEVQRFCRQNFEDLTPEHLEVLYEPLREYGGEVSLPLTEFIRLLGRPREGVLRGAPLHATVRISPWGLQTEYPEHHLLNDLVVSYNRLQESEVALERFRGKDYWTVKKQEARNEIQEAQRSSFANRRFVLLACFNLVEAYINGVAWDFCQTNDIAAISDRRRAILTEAERPVGIVDKLVKVPAIVADSKHGPLHATREPLKSFIDVIKPYRDSVVHASPFAVPLKFGGYDKLLHLYNLTVKTAVQAVETTIALLKAIGDHVGDGYYQAHSEVALSPDRSELSLRQDQERSS